MANGQEAWMGEMENLMQNLINNSPIVNMICILVLALSFTWFHRESTNGRAPKIRMSDFVMNIIAFFMLVINIMIEAVFYISKIFQGIM